MSASEFLAIGIDVGGTKIAAGLIAFPEGRVLAQRLAPTDAGRGGRPVLDDALRLARELAAAAASSRARRSASSSTGRPPRPASVGARR